MPRPAGAPGTDDLGEGDALRPELSGRRPPRGMAPPVAVVARGGIEGAARGPAVRGDPMALRGRIAAVS